MAFHFAQKVRFRHCDPARIVFYPRYVEMVNDCIESFCEEGLLWPFEDIVQGKLGDTKAGGGVPTAALELEFLAPSLLGDQLDIALSVTRIGRSSMGFRFETTCGGELRFRAASTVVLTDMEGRPTPWPEEIRGRASAFQS